MAYLLGEIEREKKIKTGGQNSKFDVAILVYSNQGTMLLTVRRIERIYDLTIFNQLFDVKFLHGPSKEQICIDILDELK